MEEVGHLLDSNAVIDFLGGRLQKDGTRFVSDVVNAGAGASVIAKLEVLGYPSTIEDEKLLKDFFREIYVVGITDEIFEICIGLRKRLKIKLPDAIIAATAIALNCKLVTSNVKDFKQIPELQVIDLRRM